MHGVCWQRSRPAMIDLAPHHLEAVLLILSEHVPDIEVRAFGSRATWTAKDYSDLDLAVVGDGPLDRNALDRLKSAFEESTLPMRVDVVDWHGITDRFRGVIKSDSVVIRQAVTPTDWRRVPLSEVATVVMGQSPPGWTYNETGAGLPFYQGSRDFGRRHPKRRVYCTAPTRHASSGDILFTVRAPVGRLNRATEDCAIGRGIASIRSGCQDDTDFLEYALRDKSDHWDALEAEGTVFGSARKADLISLEIPWPSLNDRRAIAKLLTALDDKIDLNHCMSETLDEMARVLFRSWFVDFDPVYAKAAGRPSGLPSILDDLFPDSFEPSELGPIPATWQARSLNDIATYTNGLALQRFPPTSDNSLPVIKISEMRRGFTERSTRASAGLDPRYIVGDGDVVFSWSGSLETVLWTHGPGALNQHLFKVTSTQFPRWFYWNWIREHLDEFREIADGKATTMGHIQRHHLAEAMVAVPPKDLLFAEDLPLGGITDRQISHAIQSRTLTALRDRFLPKLLSGELRLTNIASRARIVS